MAPEDITFLNIQQPETILLTAKSYISHHHWLNVWFCNKLTTLRDPSSAHLQCFDSCTHISGINGLKASTPSGEQDSQEIICEDYILILNQRANDQTEQDNLVTKNNKIIFWCPRVWWLPISDRDRYDV